MKTKLLPIICFCVWVAAAQEATKNLAHTGGPAQALAEPHNGAQPRVMAEPFCVVTNIQPIQYDEAPREIIIGKATWSNGKPIVIRSQRKPIVIETNGGWVITFEK